MIRLIVACALTLALAGCGTTSLPPLPASVTPAKVSETIAKVQSVTRQVCAFVPTAQTVASILSVLGVGGVTAVTDIAAQICTAVTTRPLADGPGDRKPRVAGVVVKGNFVRR